MGRFTLVPRLLTIAGLMTAAAGAVTPGVVAAASAGSVATSSGAPAAAASFAGPFVNVTTVASTVPANGDVNPYGVAVVPTSTGRLVAGDVLVSNFNNSSNLQGTGSTIVEVSPGGHVSLFARLTKGHLNGACPGGVGLTTGLVALESGWVVVGSLPTSDGSSATMRAGCLVVIDPMGNPVETFWGSPINGPWDMTALDEGSQADLFVSNVLNGTVAASPNVVDRGTVVRIALQTGPGLPRVMSETVIGHGLPEQTNPSALVLGPTGLGLAADGTLYVADNIGNRIAWIPDAVTRTGAVTPATLSAGEFLNGPLGVAIAPNGDILTVNSGNGKMVEITPMGVQVAVIVLDNTRESSGENGNGTLFGLAVTPSRNGVYFVDDGFNTLMLLH